MLKKVETYVENILDKINDPRLKQQAYSHTYSVTSFACSLALKRHLNIDIMMSISLLHDIALYQDNCGHHLHAQRSSEIAYHLLKDVCNQTTLNIITKAIANHSNKKLTYDDKYSQTLIDADILAHYYIDHQPHEKLAELLKNINKED